MRAADEAAAVRETHISYVFLVGDRAFKLKKPVRFEFADLTDRKRRERLCHREVELNRRLAPDVYLRVLDVVDGDEVVDHLVEMRRMPSDRRLSSLVGNGSDVDDCLRKLSHLIAAFHSHAHTSPEVAEAGTPDAVRALWTRGFDEIELLESGLFDTGTIDELRELGTSYLDGRGALLEQRVVDGRIRDGHGDLLADDIFCLDDGPRVLDCIEFDDRLRYCDVLADVAFLVMDLERLGHPELGRRFLDWYKEFSGESYPESLADFYVAYRALIRAKVAALRHGQGDPSAAHAAVDLLRIAREHLESGRVRLVLVGGLPGTGKSTLARGITDTRGWVVLRSDEIRKDLVSVPQTHGSSDFGHGIYTQQITKATYDELLSRARRLLAMGESVVLDASWVSVDDRHRAAGVASESLAELVQLRCVLPADIAADRMRQRRIEGTDVSDADADIAAHMSELFDPWPEAMEVNTAVSANEALTETLSALNASARGAPG